MALSSAILSVMKGLRSVARLWLERIETLFDRFFTPTCNPLYQLGALGWFFYWIVVASGVYLYIFFDSGLTEAYDSVEALTHKQWYLGGVLRSFHRYASDALVLVVLIHLTREFILDRLRGPRWFAWVVGVAAIWLILAAGISGYWIVWDRLGQYVAISSAEWLDALPLFGEPIARNFLHPGALSDRFFTLMVFIHIAAPLFLLLIMWVHIHRHVRAKVNPARGLAIGTIVSMLALSVLFPAYSQGKPDLDFVIGEVGLDWFYLAFLPMSQVIGTTEAWVIVVGLTLMLVAAPWLPRMRREPVAVVALESCNGCGRCHQDCPFGAIRMGPRTDGSHYRQQAVVDESLCLSCGLCVGSCPTATPFRRPSTDRAGIELGGFSTDELREQSLGRVLGLTSSSRVLVVGCRHGVSLDNVDSDAVATLSLPCVGMLPPSYIDFLLSRRKVDGIMLAGCREGGCHFRLGIEWTQERMAGNRDPYLRKRVDRKRIGTCFVGHDGERALRHAVERFRTDLEGSHGD